MSVNKLIFGKGDLIALPKPSQHVGIFTIQNYYSHPSYDWCYSKYGFAVPLDYRAIPYDKMMNDALPPVYEAPNVVRNSKEHDFLLVTHKGDLWRVEFENKDILSNIYLHNCYYIHTQESSWWVLINNLDEMDNVEQILTSYLKTDPTIEEIEEFYRKYNFGRDIEWLSIRDIKERLHQKFPLLDPTFSISERRESRKRNMSLKK